MISLRLAGALMALAALPSVSLGDELVLGRWCDTWYPGSSHELIIRVVDGKTVAFWHFTGGSTLEQELIEKSDMVFLVSDSPSGDGYRVISTSGNLHIFDDDGIIREAVRLENSPQQGDCIVD